MKQFACTNYDKTAAPQATAATAKATAEGVLWRIFNDIMSLQVEYGMMMRQIMTQKSGVHQVLGLRKHVGFSIVQQVTVPSLQYFSYSLFYACGELLQLIHTKQMLLRIPHNLFAI